MQTNREDVGKRYFEIRMPIAPNDEVATRVSRHFRDYYLTTAEARKSLTEYLAESNKHHFFIDGGESFEPREDEVIAAKEAAIAVSEPAPETGI
jgi:type I restriction enzyme M protein